MYFQHAAWSCPSAAAVLTRAAPRFTFGPPRPGPLGRAP